MVNVLRYAVVKVFRMVSRADQITMCTYGGPMKKRLGTTVLDGY